jgi:segregation and condensation protein B
LKKIRGVSCDYSVQKLLEKELITIAGRSDAPGKPIQYATSDKFMDYFGLKSMSDLPKLKEFQPAENEVGLKGDIEITVQT